MATTLTKGATVLTLPDALIWADEWEWSAVAEQRNYSLGGALLIDHALKLAGRPVTLHGTVDRGWLQRSVVQQLFDWAQLASAEMTLVYRGGAPMTVKFDQVERPVSADPVQPWSDPQPTDWCVATIRLITTG